MNKENIECPSCHSCVALIEGKITRHERGLGYVPYDLYRRIERTTGTPVKEQMKNNLCPASGIKG